MKTEEIQTEPITSLKLLSKMIWENEAVTERELMIEFAKIHVKEALQKASEKFDAECNKNVILMCYPIDKII